jgi:Rrf2 family transcriptional regulator, cysteine metabolism repressor
MLSLTKKTDYALIALGHLAANPGRTVSAREVAERFQMPGALVMNILKDLHHGGFLASTRGTKGGYRLSADLNVASLYDLITLLEGPIKLAECVVAENECPQGACCRIASSCPIMGPVAALHARLVGLLKEVTLADVLVPGRRIDVPVTAVGTTRPLKSLAPLSA